MGEKRSLEGSNDSGGDDWNDVFEALSDLRRRYVVDRLHSAGDAVTRETLSEEIAALERDASVADVPPEYVDRVRVSLHHVHLPKLASAGIVEYDRADGAVRLARQASRVTSLLDAVDGT